MARRAFFTYVAIVGASYGCSAGNSGPGTPPGGIAAGSLRWGKEVLPGIIELTGFDAGLPEIADPYVSQLGDAYLISGTSNFSLRFNSLREITKGGPYSLSWNSYSYADGTEMEGGKA